MNPEGVAPMAFVARRTDPYASGGRGRGAEHEHDLVRATMQGVEAFHAKPG